MMFSRITASDARTCTNQQSRTQQLAAKGTKLTNTYKRTTAEKLKRPVPVGLYQHSVSPCHCTMNSKQDNSARQTICDNLIRFPDKGICKQKQQKTKKKTANRTPKREHLGAHPAHPFRSNSGNRRADAKGAPVYSTASVVAPRTSLVMAGIDAIPGRQCHSLTWAEQESPCGSLLGFSLVGSSAITLGSLRSCTNPGISCRVIWKVTTS